MSLTTRQYGPNAKGSKLTIKEMDDSLLYLATSIDLQEGTWHDWNTAVQSSALIPNTRIKITDRGDLGIILHCDSSSSFSPFGVGGFLNADIQRVGDYMEADYSVNTLRGVWYPELDQFIISYTNLVGGSFAIGDRVYTAHSGQGTIISDNGSELTVYSNGYSPTVWSAATTIFNYGSVITADVVAIGDRLIANGDVVIYKNYHYIMADSTKADGNAPIFNDGAYVQLARAKRNGYIEEWDKVTYDFLADVGLWREDKRGNRINTYSTRTFQWGDDYITNYRMGENAGYLDTQNNRGQITGTQLGVQPNVYLYNNSGSVLIDVNGDSCTVNGENNKGEFQAHVVGYNSGISASQNSGEIKVYIEGSSRVDAQSNKGDIYAKYYNDAYVNHNYNSGNITNCEFNQSHVNGLSLDSTYTHNRCKYSFTLNEVPAFPANASFYNSEITNWGSTFSTEVDITGLTELNLDDYWWAGEIYLSSANATETLDTAKLNPCFDTKIIPDNGVTVTVNSVSPTSAGPYDICLEGNLPVTLVGRDAYKGFGDYLILKGYHYYNRQVGGSVL